jgi:hypothetical protein
MQLEYALAQIADIRHQMNRSRQFRGFRALTTLGTVGAAIFGGIWQAWRIGDAAKQPGPFIMLWVTIASVCVVVCAAEVIWRYYKSESAVQHELTPLAIEQFLPPVIVGGLVTLALWRWSPSALWMLPGLWQIFFGLGYLAMRRLFPMPMFLVGVFYILCGLINLDSTSLRFSPWCMAVPFAVGQAMSAAILYWYLERRHGTSVE